MSKKYGLFILLFFFISELFVVIFFMDLLIYPALNISRDAFLSGLTRTITIQFVSLIFFSIIVFYFLKPLFSIKGIKNILHSDLDGLNRYEKKLKKVIIWINFTGFIVAPLFAAIIRWVSDGFTRYATLRFVFATIVVGLPMANVQIIAINSVFINIKNKLRYHDLTINKTRVNTKYKLLINYGIIVFALFTIITMIIVSRQEKVAGIDNAVFKIKDVQLEPANGDFTPLIQAALRSSDPEVKNQAELLLSNWKMTALREMHYILVVMAVLFIAFFGFSWVYSSNFHRHLSGINKKLRSIIRLDGDLSQLLIKTSNDEIGELQVLINQLIVNLNKSFLTIYNIAKSLINDARAEKENINGLIDANMKLEEIFTRSNKEVKHMLDLFEQSYTALHETVKIINENVESIKKQSNLISLTADAVNDMSNSMNVVSGNTEKLTDSGKQLSDIANDNSGRIADVNTLIGTISDKQNEIDDIIKIIRTISAQTNLLAMNASIEAAHAKEYGRGFTVVAEEIRNLSISTNERVGDIRGVLKSITESVNETNHKSNKMQEAMTSILVAVENNLQFILEINTAAKEQTIKATDNMKAIQDLLYLTKTIGNTMNTQEVMVTSLMLSIDRVKESSFYIQNAWNDQLTFYKGLKEYFAKFNDYFENVSDTLEVLNDNLENITFLDKKYF